MHAPKQFAIGFAIVLIAAFFTRNHLRSWRDRTADTVGDYIEDWVRGYTLPIVIIGLMFLVGGALVYGSFVPDSTIVISSRFPFFHVTARSALNSAGN